MSETVVPGPDSSSQQESSPDKVKELAVHRLLQAEGSQSQEYLSQLGEWQVLREDLANAETDVTERTKIEIETNLIQARMYFQAGDLEAADDYYYAAKDLAINRCVSDPDLAGLLQEITDEIEGLGW